MDAMVERLERLEHAARAAERRARAWQLTVAALFVMGLALLPLRVVTAQGVGSQAGGLPALAARVKALEATIGGQHQEIAGLQAALAAETAARSAAEATLQSSVNAEAAARAAADAALQGNTAAVADKLVHFSRVGDEVFITGANLHIRNGLGATNGNPANPFGGLPVTNGLGNLIIGYNASQVLFGDPDLRTGSHNLIVGDFQNYSSFGGLVVGKFNSILAPFASVSGGQFNTASDVLASVSGGEFNTASEFLASVSGGDHNTASGHEASVSGGSGNTASGNLASVSGGSGNTASGGGSCVSGGSFKTQNGAYIWQGGSLVSGP